MIYPVKMIMLMPTIRTKTRYYDLEAKLSMDSM